MGGGLPRNPATLQASAALFLTKRGFSFCISKVGAKALRRAGHLASSLDFFLLK